jgi:hypothetical protein
MGDNAAYYAQDDVVVQTEEEVDENYDPTDFLHSLGQPQDAESSEAQPAELLPVAEVTPFEVGDQDGERVPVELHRAEDGTMIINALPAADLVSVPVDVINDDLDISDSDEEMSSDPVQPVGQHQAEPPPPDEDGIWF